MAGPYDSYVGRRRDNRPLDDQPDGAIEHRRRAVAGEIVNYQPKPRRAERDEFPSEDDIERFGEVTTTCPACGATLFDDVDVCYKCGEALGARRARLPGWAAVAAGLVVIGLLMALILSRL